MVGAVFRLEGLGFNLGIAPFWLIGCNAFTLLSRFSLITIKLEPDILYITGVLNDSCDGL